MKFAYLAAAVTMLMPNQSIAGNVSVILAPSDVAQKVSVSAGTANIEVYRISEIVDDRAPKMVASFSGPVGLTAAGSLAKGKYLFVSKTHAISGDLGTDFSASFLIGATVAEVGNANQSIRIPVIKFTLEHCKISPTQIFSQEYREKENRAKSAGFAFQGTNAGRIINLSPGTGGQCRMSSQFPREAIGPSSVHTYTPTSFELYDDSTLRFSSFVYNGRTENQHDLYMHKANLSPDGGKQIVIDSVQEKTGVNIPWEPKMMVSGGGCTMLVASRVNFRSDESGKLAIVDMTYLYFDDPFLPAKSAAFMVSGCK